MDEKIRTLLAAQCGTISRPQLLGTGLEPHDIDRMVRRREVVRILPRAFVDHTGEPSWEQRAWLGVHQFGPTAALDGASALRITIGPTWRHHRDADAIGIVVPAGVRREPVDGYVLRRSRRYTETVLMNLSPPRLRVEHAAVLATAECDELGVVQLLADVCQSRRTTADRLGEAIADRARVAGRRWLDDVVRDIADGTCSVLEREYLRRVERPHGLPCGVRQRAVHGGRRDVEYAGLGQVVELDGRLFHDTAQQRDVDLERDLVAAADREHAVRLGWGQVVDRPCRTAGLVARLLALRGWPGQVRPCAEGCDAPTTWRS